MVEALRIRRAPLITETQVQSQACAEFEVVLNIERGFPGFVGHARLNVDQAVAWISITQEQSCERIALGWVRGGNCRDVLREVEVPRWIVWLAEVVQKLALLESSLQCVSAANKRKCRGIRKQSVRKLHICAALVE